MRTGPFMAFAPGTLPGGFDRVPPGGVCFSAFLFLRARDGRILLGKYRDDERWERLAGMDAGRVRTHAAGWTVPATHLKLGEHPADAAQRVATEILALD